MERMWRRVTVPARVPNGAEFQRAGAEPRLLPDLAALGTRAVLLSGGEPLLNPEWREVAELLGGHGLSLWLLTSGLSLAKHARAAADLFDSITVSLAFWAPLQGEPRAMPPDMAAAHALVKKYLRPECWSR